MFYGRKQELKTLEKEYLKKNSLCSIYGARRIGKIWTSRLIENGDVVDAYKVVINK